MAKPSVNPFGVFFVDPTNLLFNDKAVKIHQFKCVDWVDVHPGSPKTIF